VSCVHKLDQVSRASFSYEFLGRRTWVVCHELYFRKEVRLDLLCWRQRTMTITAMTTGRTQWFYDMTQPIRRSRGVSLRGSVTRDAPSGETTTTTVSFQFLLISFFLFLHFFVDGSVRWIKLTHVGFRARVKIASRIVSYLGLRFN